MLVGFGFVLGGLDKLRPVSHLQINNFRIEMHYVATSLGL